MRCINNKHKPVFRGKFTRHEDYSNRVSALSPGSVRLLDKLGAWQQISQARAWPVREMQVQSSTGTGTFLSLLRIRMFLGLPDRDPDPLVRVMDPDLALNPSLFS
jgi:2-polyprenyl-6-methoxyphenol hydroxylase-like FAD-dependent oxidoreductase